jgi:hypothetical protein
MALFECPRCGTKLVYESKEHLCKGGNKSSDGGVESRHALKKGGNRKSTRMGVESPEVVSRLAAGVAPSPSEAKRGRGRPKIEEKREWEIAGVSRATWHRRQKEIKK